MFNVRRFPSAVSASALSIDARVSLGSSSSRPRRRTRTPRSQACPPLAPPYPPMPRARAHARSVARPWDARAGRRRRDRPLDLEDLLLLVGSQLVDLADVAVGELLECVVLAMGFVGAELAVAFLAAEGVGSLPAEVADLDARLLHPLVDDADDVLPPLLGEGRVVGLPNGTAAVRASPEAILLMGFLIPPKAAPFPRLVNVECD